MGFFDGQRAIEGGKRLVPLPKIVMYPAFIAPSQDQGWIQFERLVDGNQRFGETS